MQKSISKIYFSPTGNTKKTVDAMAEALAETTRDYDVTVDAAPAPREFTADDFVIFGAPVYGGRIPQSGSRAAYRIYRKADPMYHSGILRQPAL